MFRLIYFIPIWCVYILATIPLYLLGWVMVPLSAGLGRYYCTQDERGTIIYHFSDQWMIWWDNFDDGIANNTYWKAPNLFWQIIYWDLIRNPLNGLRTISPFCVKLVPEKIKFIGSFGENMKTAKALLNREKISQYDTAIEQWYLAWQGLRGTLYWQFWFGGKLWRFWSGWAIYPTDVFGITPYRIPGAGFKLQLKRVKT